MSKLVPYEFDAPAYFASALINGDTSSFDYHGQYAWDEWEAFCKANPDHLRDVVGCEGEPWIGRFNGLQCEMLTYQALGREGAV